VYHKNIGILSSVKGDDKNSFQLIKPKRPSPNTLYLLHWHENHYDSIRRIGLDEYKKKLGNNSSKL
jgi:hypothetical protein